MKIDFQSPDLAQLVSDFYRAAEQIGPDVRAVVSKGALNIKTEAKAAAPNRQGHAKLYPASITYTLETSGHLESAEIGPDKGKPQGALGNLIEFGSAHNPAEPHLVPAFEKEEPLFVAALEDAAEKPLK